jgi:hypothetical protein
MRVGAQRSAGSSDKSATYNENAPAVLQGALPERVQGQTGVKQASANAVLGTPLTIVEAAQLIGCSVWTVRQRLLPQGLPCFRSRPSGRLIFYTNQVIRWIEQQQKGGKP